VCERCGKHFRVRYADRRGRSEAWYVCDRAHGYGGEPHCQSIAGLPIDHAIGTLVAEQMTPAAVELALEVRREIEARHEEADRLRRRAIERAQIEAELAQRRFMLIDPGNRLVADTLEAEWNEKLRTLAKARDDRDRGRDEDQLFLDQSARERPIAMTTDFNKLWTDPLTPNRERKRLIAYIIDDVTLIKLPAEGTTNVHVRFKSGKTHTLTTVNPKSSAQQVKTQPKLLELVDKLLDDHIYPEIADLLNQQGLQPGGSARTGRGNTRFNALRVAYLVHHYGLRSRYDRLRSRGMLTKQEAAAHLKIHESTLTRWAEHGIVTKHAYNAMACLYEMPGTNPPSKHSSRWDRLVDRTAAAGATKYDNDIQNLQADLKEV
jgi:hypothetical protein